MSEDYEPALWRPADDHNYSPAQWREGKDIDRLVVHVSGGSAESAYNTFQDQNRQASYHYLVDFDSSVWQFVAEEDVAWHAGHWPTNQRSIGIGLAGSLSTNEDKTEQMYRELGALTAYLCRVCEIPVDRKHIMGHYQVPGCSQKGHGGFSCHSDPGQDFRWRFYLGRVRALLEA